MHEDSPWVWKGEDERIVKFANDFQKRNGGTIDYFIFGHFHFKTSLKLSEGGEMYLLDHWIGKQDYLLFDGETCQAPKME